MTLTCASICSGGKLADIGLMAAGYTPLWGVEIDEAIADVANANIAAPTLRQAAQDVRWEALEAPGLLWASPPCPNFSQAKTGGEETPLDHAIAESVCRALRTLQPRTFVLENVIGYRQSKSLAHIRGELDRLGYWSVVEHVNAADFGVPQTRRRLILRAVRGGLVPQLPGAVPWVGWFAAIADLIPTLPVSKFAAWQLARLPEALTHSSLLVGGGNTQLAQVDSKARQPEQPSFTVFAGNGSASNTRAFIVDSQNAGRAITTRDAHEPMYTVVAGATAKAGAPRAFIVEGNSPTTREPLTRDETEPIWTMRAATSHGMPRAWLSEGRVVAMTPRALARFQSVPDSYQLPEARGLAAKVIGNGVPCLLAQRIGEGLRDAA